ncbi:centrosomal protein of 68 kDa isoform X2 [Acanthopagrus latus]|uniref:centrosomal protein of 68 kDa isoform X2 n=1 Tax=Acanthopagrus latus TaxID=8177 RepID=UPI00187BD111|nr:centrosomal protein of 68 kDa isoform X2 [Acanthopagrus latus]XP_036980206.1 centrosomal protein of 68 kDa isoform X2 [Acanthopagrus latus]
MEASGRSQRWKMHVPEFKHSRKSQSSKDSERDKTRDKEGPHKSVTIAPPNSSCLTDRQYVKRKPLFSAEQHASILKKTYPTTQDNTEKENQLRFSRREEHQQHTDMKFLTRARSELTPESFSPSHSDICFPLASREDLGSPLTVSKLRTKLSHEEPTFGSPFPQNSRSAQQSLSNSFLEVQRLNLPLRQPLSSTVLYPTYSPRSGNYRPGHSQLRHRGKEGENGGDTKPFSSRGQSEGHPMTPYQANYWACAIQQTLSQTPDLHSAGWDPNRDYQALLDYTYPLRAGEVVTEWNSSEPQAESLLQTDPNMQDSGIELTNFCSSTSQSGLDFTRSSTRHSKERSNVSVGHTLSDGLPSSVSTDPVVFSRDNLVTSKYRGGLNRYKVDCHHYQHHARSSSTSAAFIRSTGLPQSRCVCGEVDEEFYPLPEKLEELQLLSRQMREVTAQLSQTATASLASLGSVTTSIINSSITLPEKQEAGVKEPEGISQDTHEGKDKIGREEMNAAQTADHRDSEAVERSSGAWLEPVVEGLNQPSLRELEALVEQLCGLAMPCSQKNRQENQEQSDSLMQHIQVFCSHLEQLIQWLYTVSEKMELLAAPTVDIDSVRSSLAEYQSFQREVSSHRFLTTSVLHTGQLLLSCVNTTSPFLRDTLLLIERQTGALETHTEHFFSSILSAMDTLTQPSPGQRSREEDLSPVGVQGFTL